MGIRVSDEYEKAQEFEVWEEHREAWDLFGACATQWRVIAGMRGGQYQGIDYQALESVMRMRGVSDQPARFEEIRHIEAGALTVLHTR